MTMVLILNFFLFGDLSALYCLNIMPSCPMHLLRAPPQLRKGVNGVYKSYRCIAPSHSSPTPDQMAICKEEAKVLIDGKSI